MKKSSWFYLFAAILLIVAPLAKSVLDICRYELMLPDFTAYCAVSRALFEGKNPFPDHYEVLFETISSWGSTVPIVYPGQMLFFALPGFLWGAWLKIAYFALNIAVLFFLTGLTLVKACGYRWRDLWTPGGKQFLYALCCFCFLSSSCIRDGMGAGQIPLILSLCVYGLFWGPGSRVLRTILFAFVAVAKYSLLPVFAPILFFKGHWKLCIASFCLFLLLSVSPVFCGNNLVEVYTGYFDAVAKTVQPGGINHYGSYPEMCHLAFFKIAFLNHVLTAAAVCLVLWLFWRERGTKEISDTLLLLAFSLTMLISYHRRWDFTLVFPLFFIRLFDFARKKQWRLGGITLLFPLFLVIPSRVSVLIVPSWIGGVIPQAGSVLYLYDNVWETPYTHIFPIMPFFTIALALWSLYLYLHVKEPYLFRIPESSSLFRKSEPSNPVNESFERKRDMTMIASIILPTFKEKDSIPPMLRALDALTLPGLEIIVADDHSPDGTEAAALETAKTLHTPVRVEQNPGVRGLAPSVVHGFSKAKGEILVCMDADGQHRPEDLPGLLAEFDRDPALSMVIGSRHVPGGGFSEKWNFFRVMCSDGAAFAARLVLGIALKDPMSGFFAIRRDAFDRVKSCLSPEGFKIMLELAFLLSLTGCDKVLEHPITFAMRKQGESKLSGRVIFQYLAMLMRFVRVKGSLRRKLASARS